MKIKLLDFIKENSNWREILSACPYNIKIKDKDELTLLKYDQINTSKWDELSLWCRGIIINNKTLEPVCVPFKKFFNYGESAAADIDLDSAKVTEKIDGSLIKLFFYDGSWHIATNGSIDANEVMASEINGMGSNVSFGTLVKQALGDFDLNRLNMNATHMFELVSPYNQVVLDYGEETALYYLGSRRMSDFVEYQEQVARENFKTPQLYDFDKVPLTMVQEAVRDKINFEGFVVVDKNFNRVKIKTEDYLMRHHARSRQVTPKVVIEVLQAGELGEFLSNLGDKDNVKVMCLELQSKYENFIKDIDSYGHMLQAKFGDDAKSAALFAKDHPYLGLVMRSYRQNSCAEAVRKYPAKKLAEILK